ncbi:MAG: hypothetical protein GXY88_01525 [Tissierellia bacterium]|nr:hypothetical protein [Tissierellia bacterium]
MKRNRLNLLVITILIMTLFLTACGKGTRDEGEPAVSDEGLEETGADVSDEPAVLRMTASETVSTYNPHNAASAQEYEQLNWVNGLLYQRIYDPEQQRSDFVPDMAEGEPIQMDEEGKVWQIKVQKGLQFADGTPIDAHSFEYSFKMLFDPKLANRNYGVMYILENADQYYTGQCEWEEVGIKVIDDYTLEITYEDVYIPNNAREVKETFAFVGCGLVHKETYEACFNEDRTENDYGSSLEKFVASGAYKPVKLIPGQYMEYEKWEGGSPLAKTTFNVDTIQVTVVTDQETALQMYENGEIDIVVANREEYDEYPDLYYSYTPDLYGIFINAKSETNPVLRDKNFRYAIFWGLDRETIVGATYRTNLPCAYHYGFTTTVPDPEDPDNKVINYRESEYAASIKLDGHPLENNCYNPDLALEYFQKAYENNGNQKIEVEMQYIEDNVTSKAWAEAIQEHFKNLFGEDRFQINLRAIPAALVYENLQRDNLNYEILAAGGIYPNIEYPWANSNWVSSGPDTYSTQYTVISEEAAQEWDDLYYKCTIGEYKHKPDERNWAAARMEEILYEEATFLPAYMRGNRYMIADHIEILMEDNVGDPFVEFALLQAIYHPRQQ